MPDDWAKLRQKWRKTWGVPYGFLPLTLAFCSPKGSPKRLGRPYLAASFFRINALCWSDPGYRETPQRKSCRQGRRATTSALTNATDYLKDYRQIVEFLQNECRIYWAAKIYLNHVAGSAPSNADADNASSISKTAFSLVLGRARRFNSSRSCWH